MCVGTALWPCATRSDQNATTGSGTGHWILASGCRPRGRDAMAHVCCRGAVTACQSWPRRCDPQHPQLRLHGHAAQLQCSLPQSHRLSTSNPCIFQSTPASRAGRATTCLNKPFCPKLVYQTSGVGPHLLQGAAARNAACHSLMPGPAPSRDACHVMPRRLPLTLPAHSEGKHKSRRNCPHSERLLQDRASESTPQTATVFDPSMLGMLPVCAGDLVIVPAASTVPR